MTVYKSFLTIIRYIMTQSNNKRPKVQAYVETYTHYVLDNLVEIKGRSVGHVAAFIIKDWIGDHKDELSEYGISVNNWK